MGEENRIYVYRVGLASEMDGSRQETTRTLVVASSIDNACRSVLAKVPYAQQHVVKVTCLGEALDAGAEEQGVAALLAAKLRAKQCTDLLRTCQRVMISYIEGHPLVVGEWTRLRDLVQVVLDADAARTQR